jgi:hypothetical protein
MCPNNCLLRAKRSWCWTPITLTNQLSYGDPLDRISQLENESYPNYSTADLEINPVPHFKGSELGTDNGACGNTDFVAVAKSLLHKVYVHHMKLERIGAKKNAFNSMMPFTVYKTTLLD